MRAYINGMGMVSACGPTLGEFRAALEAGEGARRPDGFMVDLKRADKSRLKKLRRADKLSKMSVLAAREALEDAGLYSIEGKPSEGPAEGPAEGIEAGVILATALGPHTTTFGFLDDILQYGDSGVSPTMFSNSVHNAAASYIASDCGLNGPTLTVTQFMFSFHEALMLALAWLREGRVPRVLLGAADIHGEVLGHVAGRMLKGSAAYSPGEGAAFFLLEPEPREAYSAITSAGTGHDISPSKSTKKSSLLLIDDDGMIKERAAYKDLVPEGTEASSYGWLYGSMMTGSAFNMAAAALILKEQLKGSMKENPGIDEGIEILRLDCHGRRGLIGLSPA